MKTNPIITSLALACVLLAGLGACNQGTDMSATPLPSPSSTSAPATPAPGDGAVQVWLTLPDQSKKLNREADVEFTTQPGGQAANITINPGVAYQKMEGFGASMTDSSAWLIMNVLDETARRQVMRDLFTREGGGIGLSYVRIPMGASDFALQDYTYDDMEAGQSDPGLRRFNIEYDKPYILPALRLAAALNPALRFMGSPWSAPGWMKEGGSVHGGELLPAYYQAFADYHVRFIQAYAAEGIRIDTITPQNEPMYSTGGYPTMLIPPDGQAALVRDHLGPAFRQAGLDTRIIIFDHNWDLVNYPLGVLSDPQAAAFVDGVAFHCYGGDVSSQSRLHSAYPDKGIWFTECSGGGWAPDWGDNLNWNTSNLVIGNFRNWGNSVMLWNLALDENDGPQNGGCGNCRGVVTINQSTGEVTYNEEYYILGHASKFIDPGAYRVDSNGGEDVPENAAFVNPDGSLVLIVRSEAAASFDVTWNGRSFTYSMPARSVATFKWSAGARPGSTATPAPTSTPRPTTGAGTAPAGPLLLDFETSPDIYVVSNATAAVGAVAHQGAASLWSASKRGEWHVVGAGLGPQPLDLSGFGQVCFWVYDGTSGDNTVGLSLLDGRGNRQERWTDHAEVGANPKTVRNQWVQMCMNLSAFGAIDLTRVTAVEFNAYWAGDWYFDDVTLQGTAGQ